MPRPRLGQNQNPMHMVWHDDESIQFCVREVPRDLIPTGGDHLAGLAKSHLAVSNLAEGAPAVHGADRHEIRTRLRVIESDKAERPAARFHDLSCVCGWFFLVEAAGSAMADPTTPEPEPRNVNRPGMADPGPRTSERESTGHRRSLRVVPGRICFLIDSAFSTRGRAGVFPAVRGGGYTLPGGFDAKGSRGPRAHQRAEASGRSG